MVADCDGGCTEAAVKEWNCCSGRVATGAGLVVAAVLGFLAGGG